MHEERRDRLDSWKEIASYLGRDVRTVIRWEKDRALPVHRMPGGKRQAVYAYPAEIEAWLAGQGNGRAAEGRADSLGSIEAKAGVSATAVRLPSITRPGLHDRIGGVRLSWFWAAAGVLIAVLGLLTVLKSGWRVPLLGRPALPRIQSLAVLPLNNLSGDPTQEYLADGLTEALVTDLAQIHALRVVSRTSSMHYKGTRKPLPEIARELNVDGIVEGSVLRSGGRVRITVQLIRAQKDEHMWANTYEGDASDVLALQGMAARAIVQEIRATLTPEEQTRLATVRLTDPEAQEAYLKGRYSWSQRTPESLKKSLVYFKHAIEKDPHYALAYLALAESYAVVATSDIVSAQDTVPQAKQAARRALELDGGLGQAHATLAYMAFFYDWDFRGAEQEFRRALELSPNYSTAHQWYGLLLMAEKRFDEAARELNTALAIDPLSLITSADVGQVYFYSGRYDQAIEQTQKILEINPNFAVAYDLQGMAYEQKSMYAEALAEFQKYSEMTDRCVDSRMHLAHLYAVTGKHDEARSVLHELENPPKGEFLSTYDIGSIYAGLGEKEEALRWLNRAYRERAPMLTFAGIDPLVNPLRGDPRFEALLGRVGLPH